MPEHWGVVLEGHPFDLENAARCFGNASSHPVRIGTLGIPNGRTFPAIFADAFDVLLDHSDVYREAERIVALINGALFVTDHGREPLRIASIHPRTPVGWGGGYLFVSGEARIRSNASGTLSGGTTIASGQTSEALWMRFARTEEDVRDVLLFFRTSEPDWFDLFKASELLESAARQPWWPKSRFNDFTGVAQFDRHARGPHEKLAPDRRMTLQEARRFVGNTARQWLNWWITDEAGAREASLENVKRKRKEQVGRQG